MRRVLNWPWQQTVPHAALWALLLLLFLPALGEGEFWWTDEARHAMGGVFLLDAARDLPVADPMGYALRYFAQYPALALNWYLPGFYAAEAVAFGVFGASETVARVLILGFCALAASLWMNWIRTGWGPSVALMSVAFFFSRPEWNLWARSVMLEAPAIALMIISVWALQRYMATANWSRALLLGLALAFMLLIKQSTAFLLPALLFYVLWTGNYNILLRKPALVTYILLIAALSVVSLHALKFGSQGITATVGTVVSGAEQAIPILSMDRWMLYPKTLLETWGAPLSILSALGLLVPARAREDRLALVLAWLACWYVAVTLLIAGSNAPRYTMYAMPALGLLAARPLSWFADRQAYRVTVAALLTAVLGWSLWQTYQQPVPKISGYRQLAEKVHATGTRAPLLFAGKYDGNFIFHLRQLDRERQSTVLRGDKILVSLAVHKHFGMPSHVSSTADIESLIKRYGIEFVLIESPDIVGLSEFGLLRNLVQTEAFERVATMPVQSSGMSRAPETVDVYRYRAFQPVEGAELVIPLPHMGWEIRIQMQ